MLKNKLTINVVSKTFITKFSSYVLQWVRVQKKCTVDGSGQITVAMGPPNDSAVAPSEYNEYV